MEPSPPDRTLRYWLGALMAEKRETAGLKRRHVGELVDVGDITIKRFEEAEHNTEGIDQILAAYAALLGDDDPRDYYAEALARWRAAGHSPRIETDPTARARAVSRAARGTPPRPPR